ncbi:hypothetical protein Pan189_05820 [Stratiformator vulcanicus]|uniref:Uncharacterized protein n=1 Tax=Stratiformator vulcanicus TaxID=2527980 RepID=A0A517QXA6_9PLAN|nr:hypothetical protein Pan189_05820 [Stratiformator vulcanicus]
MPHRHAGLSVREILQVKKASIRRAPLPKGSPSFDSILNLLWEEVAEKAQQRMTGYPTIYKLLNDHRFDKDS